MANEAESLALYWLSQRSLTRDELRSRLTRRGFDDERIEHLLADLISRGLVNDRRIAERVIEAGLERHEGPRRIWSRLKTRGIDTELIEKLIRQLKDETDWQEIAEPLLQRYDSSNPKERARFIRHLAREGFPTAVIVQLVGGERGDVADGPEDY